MEEEWGTAQVLLSPGCQVREWVWAGGMPMVEGEGIGIVFSLDRIQAG